MFKRLTLLLAGALAALGTIVDAANPAAEVRAVWFTTNGGMDWPSGSYTETAQKKKMTELLDKLQDANFNTIIFQVQVKGDVAWKSTKQPANISLTGNGSKGLPYDVCAYAIEECHKRNMECHAWIVPYRIGSESEAKRYDSNPVQHPSRTHKELCITHGGAYYLDPGNPATTEYLVDLYKELVTNYDFDGINFDYTRYPDANFSDAASYQKYNPNGYSKADWRRWSINCFIEEMYAMVKSIKPWMKVGAAPIGTYVNVPGYGNLTAYGDVFQDAAYWMNSGNHDLLIPQMYWNERYGFTPNMQTWVDNCAGRQIVIGLAPYKMVDGSNDWEYTVITDQIEKQRANPGTSGVCFFRTDHVTGSEEKVVSLYNELKNNYFSTPAKIPVMDYLAVTKPNPPVNVRIDGSTVSWTKPTDNPDAPIKNYVIYRKKNGKVDTDDASSIVAIVRGTSHTLPAAPAAEDEFGVTSIDRNNCESDIAYPAGMEAVAADEAEITLDGTTLEISAPSAILSASVYNMAGTEVAREESCATTIRISLSALPAGIYFLHADTDTRTYTRKIIL